MTVCQSEAARVLGAGAAADDAAQEAAVRAWRQWSQCRSPDRAPWVRRIARNEALRTAGRRSWVDIDAIADHEDPDAARRRAVWDEQQPVRAAVNQLAPRDRTLLYLYYWEARPIAELSRMLGVPEGTIRVRLHRLRSRIRRILHEDAP